MGRTLDHDRAYPRVSCPAHASRHRSRHLQGLRHPRPLRRGDRRRRRRGSSGARSRACSRSSPASRRRAAHRPRARHAALPRPSSPRRYRDGMVAEGAHVVDAGHGRHRDALLARRLARARRRPDVHRLAQPAAYTGAKLVERGAVALSGDRGIGEMRDLIAAGLPATDATPAAPPRRSTSTRDVPAARRSRSSTRRDRAAEGRARRRQRDGRPDGRPGARAASASTSSTTYWTPDGDVPRPRAEPAARRRTARFIIDKVRAEGADLGIAWDGDADRCFFIDDDGRVRARRLPHRAARRVGAARSSPGADILYDVRASRAVPDTVEPARRPRARQPRRPRVLQDAHARRGRRVRRRGLRPLLLRRLLQRRLRHDPGAADPRAARPSEGTTLSELLAPLPLEATSSRARSTPRSPDPRARWTRSRSATPTPRSRELDGISVDYDDWHFNVRPSNTEPLLRLNLESLVSAGGHGARGATRCSRLIRS